MKRTAVGILSAAMGSTLLLAPGTASAEHVTLSVRITGVSPNPVVVRDDRDTPVTVEVRTTEATRVELKLRPVFTGFRAQSAPQPKLVHEGDLWRFSTSSDDDDVEGRWLAIADAYDRDGKKVTDQVNFSVKHERKKTETRISHFRADPSAVRRGRWVFFTGRLQAYGHHGWQGVRDEEVTIYFRARHSSAWKWVTSTETGWRGKFYAKARALKSGEYRAVYEGDDGFGDSDSRPVWIRVWR